jgi:hypothetical protein
MVIVRKLTIPTELCQRIAWYKYTDVSEEPAASSVFIRFNLTTRRNIPEGSNFHTYRRENLSLCQDSTATAYSLQPFTL